MKVRLIPKPQLSTTIKKRSFPRRGLFSFFYFSYPSSHLFTTGSDDVSLSTLWQLAKRGKCVRVCARKEGLFISNPGFLFPLRSDSHNNTQLCEFMLCPFPLSFSVCLSLSLSLSFPISLKEMNFSSLHASV